MHNVCGQASVRLKEYNYHIELMEVIQHQDQ